MSLTLQTIKASSWLFGQTAIAILGGIFKTAIVSRILTPAQFGIFGIATLALNLLQTFSETSIDQALIQKKDLKEVDLTTAWFISIVRGFIIGAILFFAAPFIGAFFNEPGAVIYIKVIALSPIIRNFCDPKITLFRRKLNFKQEFLMNSSGTIIEIIVAIAISFYTRSAWGLVAALLVGSLSDLIFSFAIMPKLTIMLPSKQSLKDLLGFSSWLWASSIVTYLVNEGDDIFVGRFLNPTQLAFYQQAFKISSLPATQFTGIAGQAVYPALSSIQSDKPRLARAFFKSFKVTVGVTLLVSLGIIILAEPLTLVLMGSQWLPIIPALRVLTIYGIVRSLATAAGPILKTLGRPDIITKFALMRLTTLAAFIYPLTNAMGIVGTSRAVVISTLLPQPYLIWVLKKLLTEKN